MRKYCIANIPGDGIGPEVVAEGVKVLDTAAEETAVEFEYDAFPWGCGFWIDHGVAMPDDGLDTLADYDAIYLGAAGLPGQVPEEVGVRELVLKIRSGFQQFANIRPVRPMEGCPWYLSQIDPSDVDFVVVREATEGFYCNLGGRYTPGDHEIAGIEDMLPAFEQSTDIALQTGVFSEQGCRRVIRFAFDLARSRDGKKTVMRATKTNALCHGMTLWDEVFEKVAAGYPDIEADWHHVDALAMRFVMNPDRFDVVVAPNLFGDILTDLSAVLVGGLGFAPGGNISRTGPSMFEPPHGSAPDIMGRGVANPIAAILTAALMAEHLGEPQTAQIIREAVADVVRAGETLTPDAGGKAGTAEVGNAIAAAIKQRS